MSDQMREALALVLTHYQDDPRVAPLRELHAGLSKLAELKRAPRTERQIDEHAVDMFTAAMIDKLRRARESGRHGWHDPNVCSIEYLEEKLMEHVLKGDPVDVANFAMMLWMRGHQ